MSYSYVALLLLILGLFTMGSCELWCYSCVSAQPGCEEFSVDWRIHHAITCRENDDKCVKIIEKNGASSLITRDCLSNLKFYRDDIPADRYDGCRPAAANPKLAVYVHNDISQLEIKKRYWEEVTYCFCEFDQWCNSAVALCLKKSVLVGVIFLILMDYILR